MRDAVGVIHGRFQILHLDHMKYLLEGKKRCDYLLIGISNPDMTTIKYVCADPHRSESLANPLTYYERFWMIRGAMLESGVSAEDFDIIPFPINRAELLGNYAPKDATYYMTIYDAWGLEKKRLLEDMGCAVDVMWQRPCTQKGISGTDVRNLIIADRPWAHLVPPFVYRYIVENRIDVRLREMYVANNDSASERLKNKSIFENCD